MIPFHEDHLAKGVKPQKRLIRCRWCQWATPPWITRQGKRKNYHERLKSHVEDNHPEYFEEIEAWLGQEDTDETD